MNQQEEDFHQLSEQRIQSNKKVKTGKMMSAPGLKVNDKVFAFYHKNCMCFRIGPDLNLLEMDIVNYSPLSPFKKKPPLKGWYYIDGSYMDKWGKLTELALEYTQAL